MSKSRLLLLRLPPRSKLIKRMPAKRWSLRTPTLPLAPTVKNSNVSTTSPRLLDAEVAVAEVAVVAAKTVNAVEAVVAVEIAVETTAVVVVAVANAVAVVVVEDPELLELKARRAPLSTVLRPVASAIATRARPVRRLTQWTDVTVPDVVAEATARKASPVAAGVAADLTEKKVMTLLVPRRRPSRPAASPLPLLRKRKLATLLTTSWLTNRPSPRVF